MRDLVQIVGILVMATIAITPSPTSAGLLVTHNNNVAVSRSTFLATTSGVSEFVWADLFAPGAHTTGQLIPSIFITSHTITLPDLTQNTILTSDSFVISNQLDGWPGFDGLSGAAVADMTVNNTEVFEIQFDKPHLAAGFPIQYGTAAGNPDSGGHITNGTGGGLQAGGLDLLIQSFDSTNTLIDSILISFQQTVPQSEWVSIVSDTAFNRLTIDEQGPDATNQYFGNVLTAENVVVPEPSTLLLMMIGLGGYLCHSERRKQRNSMAING